MGLKENVIIGHLIPAGTGIERFQGIEVSGKVQPAEEENPEGSVESEQLAEVVETKTEQ